MRGWLKSRLPEYELTIKYRAANRGAFASVGDVDGECTLVMLRTGDKPRGETRRACEHACDSAAFASRALLGLAPADRGRLPRSGRGHGRDPCADLRRCGAGEVSVRH